MRIDRLDAIRRTAPLLLALFASPAVAQDTCKDPWNDGRYVSSSTSHGVELKVCRFCMGGDLDHKVQACGKLENHNQHAVRVRWRFVAQCRLGGAVEEGDWREDDLEAGQSWGGGGFQMSPECFTPCGPYDVPTRVGWRVDVVDTDEEEKKRALKEQMESEQRARDERDRQAAERRLDEQKAEEARRLQREERERNRQGAALTAAEARMAAAQGRRDEADRRERERREEARERYEQGSTQAAKENQQRQESFQAAGAAMASGPDRATRPSDWISRLTLQLGVGGLSLPLVYDATGLDLSAPYSAVTAGGGLGMSIGVEAWPVLGKSAGLALVGSYGAAFFSLSGGTSSGAERFLGAKGVLGDLHAFFLIAEVGSLELDASTSGQVGPADVYESGTGHARGSRLGLGVGACTGDRDGVCTGSLELTAFKDAILGTKVTVLRAAWRMEIATIIGEWGREYPALGTATYPLDGKTTDSFYTLYIAKELDFDRPWGRPAAR